MYFEKIPNVLYQIGKNSSVLVKDIVRAIRIDPRVKTDPLFFMVYRSMDDETPEMISHRFYKSTQYHWVIMLINERYDPYEDFPKSDIVLRDYCAKKYSDPLGVHHYVGPDGFPVDEFNESKIVITNLEYETQRNETLRTLKILKPEVLSEFVGNYEELIAR